MADRQLSAVVSGEEPARDRRLARHVAEVAGASDAAGKCLRLEFSVAPQAAGPA
jgi:23S rRNA (adenine2030-N6)-methyltransferase